MPSSELSIIHFGCWSRYASRLESLLLGMHKNCAQVVESLVIVLVQLGNLYTLTTAAVLKLFNCVAFVNTPLTIYQQEFASFKQPERLVSETFFINLYSSSTSTINKTNKGFSI